MSLHATAEARAASLRRLHALVRRLSGDLDLDRTLGAVARGVVEGLGFGVAVVNLVVPGGDLVVVACEGDAGVRDTLLGERASRAVWDRWLQACEPVGELLVDYRHGPEGDDLPTWVPRLAPGGGAPADRPAWDPQDALLAPLRTSRSGLLGVVSVDLPHDGLRPGADQLELLEMYAAQASLAVENAQLHSSLRRQDEERAQALGRLSAVVGSAPVGIVELDLEGRVRLWNPEAERMFGWSEVEVLGRPNPVAAGHGYAERLRGLLDGGTERVEAARLRRDGSRVEVDMTSTALRDAQGRPYGYLGVYSDATERRSLERELRTAAYTDALTGLGNRAWFLQQLVAAGPAAGVVLLDLDGFKGVNDTLGHPAGDAVLVEVAQRLRAVCRDGDVVARLGGDEFVVLPAADGAQARDEAAEALSKRLVDVLAEPFGVGDRLVPLGASVGVAHPSSDSDAESLLRDADVAMYAAKAAGKGRARVFEPALREAVVERTDLVQDLRAALVRGELAVRWHPVAEVASARVVGLEALVRWQHPVRGELPPRVFIGLAEETGLVVPLGEQVLATACGALRRWQRGGRTAPPRPALVGSVNLSPVQVRSDGLVDAVAAALRESGLPPASLVLELTEDVLLADVGAAVAVLQELRALGVRLALDDFGAGYSSFAYLRHLPVQVVKLDRGLLVGADSDPRALALLDAVVALTRRLGLRAVAEGVESAAQWALLRRLGCHLAQGYLLSAPLREDEVPRLLAAGHPSSAVPGAGARDAPSGASDR